MAEARAGMTPFDATGRGSLAPTGVTPTCSRFRSRRGFSLIELAIVLAVLAILATALTPSVVESMRSRMAEKAAADVSALQDAAKWYFVESAPAERPEESRWPGQVNSFGSNSYAECRTGTSSTQTPRIQLTNGGYTNPRAFSNPWGSEYELTLSGNPGCSLIISTNLPAEVAGAFQSFLPAAACETGPGNPTCPGEPPPGGARCCSRIPKPGGEASVLAALKKAKSGANPTLTEPTRWNSYAPDFGSTNPHMWMSRAKACWNGSQMGPNCGAVPSGARSCSDCYPMYTMNLANSGLPIFKYECTHWHWRGYCDAWAQVPADELKVITQAVPNCRCFWLTYDCNSLLQAVCR